MPLYWTVYSPCVQKSLEDGVIMNEGYDAKVYRNYGAFCCRYSQSGNDYAVFSLTYRNQTHYFPDNKRWSNIITWKIPHPGDSSYTISLHCGFDIWTEYNASTKLNDVYFGYIGDKEPTLHTYKLTEDEVIHDKTIPSRARAYWDDNYDSGADDWLRLAGFGNRKAIWVRAGRQVVLIEDFSTYPTTITPVELTNFTIDEWSPGDTCPFVWNPVERALYVCGVDDNTINSYETRDVKILHKSVNAGINCLRWAVYCWDSCSAGGCNKVADNTATEVGNMPDYMLEDGGYTEYTIPLILGRCKLEGTCSPGTTTEGCGTQCNTTYMLGKTGYDVTLGDFKVKKIDLEGNVSDYYSMNRGSKRNISGIRADFRVIGNSDYPSNTCGYGHGSKFYYSWISGSNETITYDTSEIDVSLISINWDVSGIIFKFHCKKYKVIEYEKDSGEWVTEEVIDTEYDIEVSSPQDADASKGYGLLLEGSSKGGITFTNETLQKIVGEEGYYNMKTKEKYSNMTNPDLPVDSGYFQKGIKKNSYWPDD